MPTLDISNAKISDMTNTIEDVEIASMNTDGITDQKETKYNNTEWTKWWGYFNAIPDLHSALLMKSIWNVGKGFEVEPAFQHEIDHIQGNRKEGFEEILFNADLIRNVGGDSYAEIIRADNTAKTIINLKPLDPGSMSNVYSGKGEIIRYEQTARTGGKITIKKFKPNEIFHLTCNRLADQIHGISRIKAVEESIKANNENFVDLKQLMHHQVRPFLIFKWKTDDEVKIAEIKAKIDKLRNLGEDLHLPADDDVLEIQEVKINLSDIVFTWRTDLRNQFYRTFGLPLVIFGAGGSTESGGKMEMFAHETLFTAEQRYLERQVWRQLGWKIKLNSPVGLSQNLLSDEQKDGAQGLEVQPQDTAV